MFSLSRFQSSFTSNWKINLLALLMIAFLLRLGFWQCHRAEEKASMLNEQKALLGKAPLQWNSGNPLPRQYEPMTVTGHFLPSVLLLDNQHRAHQFGYDVISPFELADKTLLLIDRGWVAGDMTRQHLPVIDTPSQVKNIIGSAYYPSKKQFLLGPAIEDTHANPMIIEVIDTKMLSQLLHKSVYPFIIRQDPNQSFGYERQWEIVSMSPDRHLAYAFQWFAMASAVFILLIVLNIKKKNAHTQS